MTRQEMFDKIWNHFIEEDAPWSVSEKWDCQYRGGDGKKCAVGLLLPDSLYHPDMEGKGIERVFLHFPEVKAFFGEHNMHFLDACQRAHDRTAPISAWMAEVWDGKPLFTRKLLEIARVFGLEVPLAA